ncbi:HNH endonuclease [Marinobacter nauticus]|uniref:HNH endonuclease signature motif containing protein n=1 Tax=Marinobacter nauticus TaxID=2743 RepID=UPI00112F88FF|nr:HNH endonuclease signature motif containing protein [Marinobacter nauticus]TPW22690.1 HNH endonuclease [Marinobacter nauticus]
MAVTSKTKIQVWGESAARCAHCREQLIYSEDAGLHESLVGEVCHIFAQGEKGPRANPNMPQHELDSPKNLLLLCRKHHKYVDDHPELFSVERLAEIKLNHLIWVGRQLSVAKSWSCNLATLHYLNIPRLTILSAMSGEMVSYDIDTSKGLYCLGAKLLGVMNAYQRLLENMHPKVSDMPDFKEPTDDQIGLIFKFNDRFRTKNAPWPDRTADYSDFLTGNIDQDPHIYKTFGDCKLTMVIDPRWITTTTAFSEFIPSAGHNKFSGLAMVKSIDQEAGVVTATPLVIGIPKSPLQSIFEMEVSDLPRAMES